ncbi:membrane-associated phospholipid phosphatase [Clostridium aceticum]|uniref:Membrane-associated phospholipid phosphatase n=1 Tax=Clostridium aceticum TaxID=84022 RepID=A0A0D8IAW8_9CLOT|nr:phosphatase PAP2 family protein [Clostridium aceticum]AKL97327.1 membrane-associated phospholipid phosphatase [Clostridium aceticum]KJF26341.1 hypothetical protein TZ02_14340 [Clostridium aceticum]
MGLDLRVLEFVYRYLQNATLDVFMVLLSRLGDYGLLWLIISLGLMISKKHKKLGYMSLSSILLGFITGELILKNIIQRNRPFLVIENINLSIAAPQSFSFPSGHTLIAFATVGVIIRMIESKVYKKLLIALACLMGFSRVYLRVHYPTDVLAGAVIGLMVSFIIYKIFAWKEGTKKV